MKFEFKIVKTEDAKDLPLPKYMTEGSSGMDLYANVSQEVILGVGERKLIPTGIKISIPRGFEVQVRPRSGLAIKNGVTLLNSPGTVDSDYRGEIKVILVNLGEKEFIIKRGERIAQMVISEVRKIEFMEVDELDISERGEGGFGHTGIN